MGWNDVIPPQYRDTFRDDTNVITFKEFCQKDHIDGGYFLGPATSIYHQEEEDYVPLYWKSESSYPGWEYENRCSITKMIMEFGKLESWESPSQIFPNEILNNDVYNDSNEDVNPYYGDDEHCAALLSKNLKGNQVTKYCLRGDLDKHEAMQHIVNYYVFKKIVRDPKCRTELEMEPLPANAKKPQIYFFCAPSTKKIEDLDNSIIATSDTEIRRWCIGGNKFTMHEFEYIMGTDDIREHITFVIGAYEELYPLLQQAKEAAGSELVIDDKARTMIGQRLKTLSELDEPKVSTVARLLKYEGGGFVYASCSVED